MRKADSQTGEQPVDGQQSSPAEQDQPPEHGRGDFETKAEHSAQVARSGGTYQGEEGRGSADQGHQHRGQDAGPQGGLVDTRPVRRFVGKFPADNEPGRDDQGGIEDWCAYK